MCVLVGCCLVDQVLCHLDLVCQVHHAELQVLELGDGLAELLALLHVLASDLECALCDTQSLGSDADTAAVQGLHCGGEALAGGGDHVACGDADVIKVQLADHSGADAHGVVACADGEAGGVALDNEGSHGLGAQLTVGQSVDCIVVGQGAVGDEALGAVDDPLVAVALSEGQHAGNVGACGVLGQAEGAEVAAAHDGGHPALELLVGSFGEVQGTAVQRGGNGEGDGQGCVDLGDLLDGQSILHVAQTLAAVFLGIGQTNEAHLRQFLVQVHVVLTGLVTLQDAGGDLLLSKFTSHLLDRQLLFIQFKIHKTLSFFILVQTNRPCLTERAVVPLYFDNGSCQERICICTICTLPQQRMKSNGKNGPFS